MEEESKSLIPDSGTSSAPSGDVLPTASIIPNEEDHPLVPDDPNPLNDNGSLVPDSEVIESGEHEPEAKKEETPIATPTKEDDGYRVPPEPTNDIPVAGVIKEEDKKAKTKKPLNIKKLAIIGGSVLAAVAVVLLAIFVVVPIIEKNSRISLDNTIKAALIREKTDEDTKYAVFNTENGKQLTDFIFSSATDFADGYALVSDTEGAKSGIVSSGGAMSVAFGKYGSIKKIDAIYEVENDDGLHRLIKGNDEVIADVSDKVEYYDGNHFAIVKSNDKYYVVDTKTGDKKFEFESNDKPVYSHDSTTANFNIIGKNRVLIFEDGSLEPIVDQKTTELYEIYSHSKDYRCLLLASKDKYRHYGVLYNGKFKEYESDVSLTLRDQGSTYGNHVRLKKPCIFYSDSTASYNTPYRDGFKIMNESFELVSRPYYRSSGTDILMLDADHMLTYTRNNKTSKYDVEFYVNGALVKRAESNYSPNIVDNSYALTSVDSSYKTTYYLYSSNGEIIEQSIEHDYAALDEYGNRLLTRGIYSKDYKVLTPDISTFGLARFHGYYYYEQSSSNSVNIIDPKTGKFKLNEGLYRSIEYNEDNNVYVGTRDDGATDILDDKFELITNVTGKVEMRQNYYAVSGASITELFTLKGEKFYAYE